MPPGALAAKGINFPPRKQRPCCLDPLQLLEKASQSHNLCQSGGTGIMRLAHFSKLTWSGIGLILFVIIVFLGWDFWLQTRLTRPVYMPVSLAMGNVHVPSFRLNLSGPYEIRIEAKKRIPYEKLNCLLGMTSRADKKCDVPSVIRASWILTSNEAIIAKGTSDSDSGGAWGNDVIEREIGNFKGNWNCQYQLEVNFITDGSALAATDPHLVVEITSDFYEGGMWISYFLLIACSALGLIGAALLSASGIRIIYQGKKEKRASTS